MLHEPAVVDNTIDNAAEKKAKLGIKLFFIYTIVYAGFVAIGLTKPELLGMQFFAGLNLAIVYAFGLIILAVVMGFIYNAMCTRLEDKMNKN